jgi:hypothetical protein
MRKDSFGLRVQRRERQKSEHHAKKARRFDKPRLIGLRVKREHAQRAFGRAGFFKRPARQRRDRLARNAGATAHADGDNSARGFPAHGLTSRHCTIGIAARQPE